MLYRYTYNGMAIMDAYDNECKRIGKLNELNDIAECQEFLPHVEKDGDKYFKVYFTEEGKREFDSRVMKYITQVLDQDKIKIEEIEDNKIPRDMLEFEDTYQQVYNIDRSSIISEELDMIDEVYFGKTPSILKIEETLEQLRKTYRKGDKLPVNDSLLNKLNRLIKDQFGLWAPINIVFDPVPSINSLPMSGTMSLDKMEQSYIVDSKTYKFRPESRFICIINITSGLIFNLEFTTEEIMAAILHELGFIFSICMTNKGPMLYNIQYIAKYAKKVMSIITNIYYNSKVGELVKDKINGMLLLPEDDPLSLFPPDQAEEIKAQIANLPPAGAKAFLDELTKGIIQNNIDVRSYSNKVAKTYNYSVSAGYILGAITSSDIWRYLITWGKEKSRINNTVKSAYISFLDYLNIAIKYIMGIFIGGINRIITRLGLGKQPTNVIQWLGIDDMIVPYLKIIESYKNPLNFLLSVGNTVLDYKIERFASNFVTMYGYGASEISYFKKMNSNSKKTWIKYIVKKCPFIGAAYDTIMIPAKILNGIFDPTPSGVSRCMDQIHLLENELTKQNLDPDIKIHILEDIKSCKKELRDLININKGIKDPDIIKKLYNKFLSDVMDGTELKDRFFNDINKFKDYDTSFLDKLNKT